MMFSVVISGRAKDIILYMQSLYYLVVYAQVYHPNIDLEGNVCLNILR